jgi:hypothetical protein
MGDVDAEPVDAEVEPESKDRLELGPDLGVGPVEVGLLGGEQMQVPLAWVPVGLGDAGPGGAAEDAAPVVGRQLAAGAAAGTEEVPLPLARARVGGQRRLEPGMLVRGVVGDDVQNHSQPVVVRFLDQGLGLGQRAECRLDRAVVADVVAAVDHGRGVPRVDPDGVDAQVPQIGQAGSNAGDVADPVTVSVGEAADVDLIDDRAAPPPMLRGGPARWPALRHTPGRQPRHRGSSS